MSKKLAKIFLVINLSGCGYPLVTLVQLDTKNNIANPFKITKYDMDKCELVVEEQPSFPIENLHGGFCVSAKDAAEWKAKAQSDCKAKNENRNSP